MFEGYEEDVLDDKLPSGLSDELKLLLAVNDIRTIRDIVNLSKQDMLDLGIAEEYVEELQENLKSWELNEKGSWEFYGLGEDFRF